MHYKTLSCLFLYFSLFVLNCKELFSKLIFHCSNLLFSYPKILLTSHCLKVKFYRILLFSMILTNIRPLFVLLDYQSLFMFMWMFLFFHFVLILYFIIILSSSIVHQFRRIILYNTWINIIKTSMDRFLFFVYDFRPI